MAQGREAGQAFQVEEMPGVKTWGWAGGAEIGEGRFGGMKVVWGQISTGKESYRYVGCGYFASRCGTRGQNDLPGRGDSWHRP